MLFFTSTDRPIPDEAIWYSGEALYATNYYGSDVCACDNAGNCYRPYGIVGFHAIPYCKDNDCDVYLAAYDEKRNESIVSPGHIIDDFGHIQELPDPFKVPVGRNSGYPVISSMGCNGCEELKSYRCVLPVKDFPDSRKYRIPIGLNKVDDTYINGIRLGHLITFVIDTLSMILAMYLIIGKSKKEMKMYRWFLLNIAHRFYVFLVYQDSSETYG
uniref:Uncharacterized protein n=1 Tax=Acrobeloides nanus TaxID=290746 RepID=A0A914DGG3_9BILA